MINTLLAVLAAVALASLKDVLHRLAMAIVGPKVVEWLVLSALRWLAKQTKSNADDALLEHVEAALGATEPSPALELSKEAQPTEASAPQLCPTCAQPLPK